jgi:hypothetical protein
VVSKFTIFRNDSCKYDTLACLKGLRKTGRTPGIIGVPAEI